MFKIASLIFCFLNFITFQNAWADQPLMRQDHPQAMDYTIEQKAKMYVVGIGVKTSNQKFYDDASPLWEKFHNEKPKEKIPNRLGDDVFAVYTHYEGDFTKPYTYIMAYPVKNLSSIPSGMMGVEIPAGKYAVFTAKNPQSIGDTWNTIWNSKIDRTYIADYELYPSDFNPEQNSEVKIYIGIKE